MCSLSSRVRSFHDVSWVPQYPQNWRRVLAAKGEVKVRRILDRVSSGNCANVADEYQGRGTRSQRASGLPEWLPGSCVSSCLYVDMVVTSQNSRDADVLSYRSSACCT